MLGPVIAGLYGTVLPAFGHLPAAGLTGPSLDPFRDLFDWGGLGAAVRLSVTTGVVATGLSLLIVSFIVAGWSGTRSFRVLERLLSPLLSVPHAAAAFGLAFLIVPSGWIARATSPWLTGWDRPPDLLIVQDPLGFAMVAGLVVKEVPFLLLMMIAAMGQAQPRRSILVAQALGYGRVTGWLKTVFPRVYAQIRLPVYVVIGYSMSVVDVAVILGPSTPPTLSVQIVKWMSDPDLAMRLTGAAAALLQFALVAGVLLAWWLGERVVAALGRRWIWSGRRGQMDAPGRIVGLAFGVLSAASILLGLASLAIWSFAARWSFPNVLPDGFTMRSWDRHGASAFATMGETFLIAGCAVGIALVLVLGCLEAEHRGDRQFGQKGLLLLYLPLLVPQTAFLPGLQTMLLTVGADMGRVPVIFAHLVFVLPYVFLSLGDPWRSWDARHATVAAALGASPWRVFWSVRVPMLTRPLLTVMAVGVAVSVGQYLATLLIGGGRVETLTTEAVALASGGDRRAIGVYGLLQTLAALVPFTMALVVPTLLWRNRRGLHE
ncbi:ABC transporter permease [Pseudooctadecabacter jejudonensis]|uniref:Inner membrane ABC transporter permease protein YnjC n=1 Tax=Pseudooctadecabacter jejudonensis TaxID=1391910 RepID=A0A1Y5S4D2_9RHOB|nr:ABC transporter permease subunit [Pseudooctadecabacter jejudonensis]SLN32327.1 Inner membrane ABC transporter permease protein YnjC [Pseudooctadecabacter jejudonensis]